MRTSLLTLSLAISLLLGSLARAEDAAAPPDAADEAISSSPHKLYVGVGFFNDTIGVNGEVVTRWGNFAYMICKDQNQQLMSHGNWRTPIGNATSGHDSGYYVGVFGGQVADYSIGGKPFRLFGAGADLGYHWVDENTRSVASVGMGTTQKISYNGVFQNSQPTIFFNLSIALGRH